ncbi:hypothetical protein DY251_16295 [Mesorhizobium denitrificans]|uniref:Uncharacterized protein n=1 Tax=Mesorhizobium denitrificans TaxID=2294114 RepID=A0A371X9G4_9HYPH|nr:hypothetical protein DY251_16295 [Mesorhizobium denitrificans]
MTPTCAGIALVLSAAVLPTGTLAREIHKSEFIVTCTSALAWDIGPCTTLAIGRCKGRGAKLLGALASTFLAANKLYQTTARYKCRSA